MYLSGPSEFHWPADETSWQAEVCFYGQQFEQIRYDGARVRVSAAPDLRGVLEPADDYLNVDLEGRAWVPMKNISGNEVVTFANCPLVVIEFVEPGASAGYGE